MKQFIGGDGSDTTVATKAYLLSNDQLELANLFLLCEPEDPKAQFLTDYESPLSWPVYGTFKPGVTKRDQIKSKIGLEVDDFSFEWSPPLTPFTNDVATANPYQLARLHFYDGKPFRMWRTVMPVPGDANYFGACILFGGRVRGAEISRGKIVMAIESFLNVVNQLVPPNVIEVTNTLAGYKGATPVLDDGENAVARFTVAAPSNDTTILGSCVSPTFGKVYGKNKFQFGYMVFTSGALAGTWSAIAASDNFNAGGGVHYNEFFVYSPFPWDPAPGDQFYVSTAYPVDGSQSPFLHVPAPETAI